MKKWEIDLAVKYAVAEAVVALIRYEALRQIERELFWREYKKGIGTFRIKSSNMTERRRHSLKLPKEMEEEHEEN